MMKFKRLQVLWFKKNHPFCSMKGEMPDGLRSLKIKLNHNCIKEKVYESLKKLEILIQI